jgi:hypothetical protein
MPDGNAYIPMKSHYPFCNTFSYAGVFYLTAFLLSIENLIFYLELVIYTNDLRMTNIVS